MPELSVVKNEGRSRMGRNEAAKLFSSPRQFGRLVERGLIAKGEDGKFDRDEVLTLAEKFGDQAEAKSMAEVEYTSEITRGMKANGDHVNQLLTLVTAFVKQMGESYGTANAQLLARLAQSEQSHLAAIECLLEVGQARAQAEVEKVNAEASARMREKMADRALAMVPHLVPQLAPLAAPMAAALPAPGPSSAPPAPAGAVAGLGALLASFAPENRLMVLGLPGELGGADGARLTAALKMMGLDVEAELAALQGAANVPAK